MQMSWRTVPMLRAAAAMAAGIGLAHVNPNLPVYSGMAISILATLVLTTPISLHRQGRVKGSASLLLFFGLGLTNALLVQPGDAGQVLPEGHYFVAELLEAPVGNSDWLGADARIVEIHGDTGPQATDVKARLMIHREALAAGPAGESADVLGRGSVIAADAYLNAPTPPRNPHTFDYGTFLASRGIRLQAWLRAGDYTSVKSAAPPTSLERVRGWISAHIDRGFDSPREAGVAKALLIGDRSGIDESTRLAYTSTGAVHVLAVSGLHTGIIAFIVVWVLRRTLRKRLPVLQLAVLLLGLWAYAALTGYSPSVLRSAVMFAVVFAGRMFRQDPNGLNNLGVAAILTLVYDPRLLFTLGFQLSYLAVAGIMVFYPHIRRTLATETLWLNKVTELVAVSVAATVGTLPVTIFFFHQFPVYFALSGIVAVPLVGVALPVLLATIAIDALVTLCGGVATWFYWGAYSLVWVCNEALTYMSALPYALVEGLWPSSLTVVLLLLTIVLFGITITRRRRGPMYVTMALALLATVAAVTDAVGRRRLDEVIVYSLRDGTAVDVFARGTLATVSDERATEAELTRETRPHRYANGIRTVYTTAVQPIYRDSGISFFQVGEVAWAEVHARSPDLVPSRLRLDWVYLADPSKVDPEQLVSSFPQARILLGARVPPWRRDAWLPYVEQTFDLSETAFRLSD